MAGRYLHRERPDHTLQPTALINEAYLRLVDQNRVSWANRAQFFGIAANIMRTQFRATSGREPVMKEKVRFLGLDVHAETIAVAVAEPDGEVRSLGTIPNRGESIRKMIKKLGPRWIARIETINSPVAFLRQRWIQVGEETSR